VNRLILLLAVLPAMAAAPAPPPSSAALETMLRLCVPFRSQPIQALAAADAAGWAPASRKMVPPVPEEMTDGGYRFMSTRKAMTYLMAGYGPAPYDPAVNLSFCGIVNYPEDSKASLKLVEAWAGGAPYDTDPEGGRYYGFLFDAKGERTPVDISGQPFERGMREGRAGVLVFAGEEDHVFLGLWTPAQTHTT
jgi:hypothetical protein